MALGLAELRGQIRFHQLPCDFRSDRAAAHAQDIHVVVFHSLTRRKVILNEAGANTRNLIGADLGADTAAADGDAALHLAGRNRASEGDDEIGVVVAGNEAVRAEVDDFVSSSAETVEDIVLQVKSSVIGCNPYAHTTPPSWAAARPGAAAESARSSARAPRTRPAGIAGSPAIRRFTISAYPSPVTTHRTFRARLRMGYVSVIRRRP